MWIAKNSVTGKEYGKKFDSIYDCQAFIDKHLKLLEYEMQRAFSMEETILRDIEISQKAKNLSEELCLRFQLCFSCFEDSYQNEQMRLIVQDCFKKHSNQRELDRKLTDLAKTNWQKNNIIRCYYVEQKRFADGFDF